MTIRVEKDYFCGTCGRNKPSNEIMGKCVKCNKYVCYNCGKLKNDKVHCQKCDTDCFIATAAYGSVMARELVIMRNFRDEALLPSRIGSSFVELYYTVSPPIAEFIRRKESLQKIIRFLLDPIIRALKKRKFK